MDDQFDQWQQAQQVAPQTSIPNQNNQLTHGSTNIQILTPQTGDNTSTHNKNDIQQQNLMMNQNIPHRQHIPTNQTTKQQKITDDWIFGLNQVNPISQQHKQQKIQNNKLNNYFSFDNIKIQYPNEQIIHNATKSLPNIQYKTNQQIPIWKQQIQQNKEQIKPVMTSLNDFNLNFNMEASYKQQININNQIKQNQKSNEIVSNNITISYQNLNIPVLNTNTQVINNQVLYKLEKPEEQQQWQWEYPPVPGPAANNNIQQDKLAISNDNNINAVKPNIEKNQENIVVQHQNNKQNEEKVQQQTKIQKVNQNEQDDEFAWAQPSNQAANNINTQQLRAQQAKQQNKLTNSQQKIDKQKDQEQDDDQFGDFQGQSSQNSTIAQQKVAEEVKPAYTEEHYEKVMNFLSRLPDYSYIQASSFMSI